MVGVDREEVVQHNERHHEGAEKDGERVKLLVGDHCCGGGLGERIGGEYGCGGRGGGGGGRQTLELTLLLELAAHASGHEHLPCSP